jgi:hypothetical protein
MTHHHPDGATDEWIFGFGASSPTEGKEVA